MKMITIPTDVGKTRRHTRGAHHGAQGHHGLIPWLLKTVALLAILICPNTINAQSLKFVGSLPGNGSVVESLDKIVLKFDLSDVVASFGGTTDEWGVCCNAYYDEEEPEEEMSAALYLGSPEDGIVLDRLDSTIKPNKNGFVAGGEFIISFPGVEVKAGQEYSIVVTYDMYACRIDKTTWERTTKYSFFNNPLVLTFVGGDETKKVLEEESNSISDDINYEYVPDVKITFNYDVAIKDYSNVGLYEGENLIAVATEVNQDSENNKTLIVKFPETILYNGHSYTIEVPTGTVNVLGEEDIINETITISLKGASYRYFGIGRVRPSNGSISIIDEITVPFKFPTAEDKTYGFVNVDNGNKKWYIHIYEGSNGEGEELLAVEGEVGEDNQSLIFRPEYAFEPDTEYTLIIPEGDILAYEIGASRETYLKDYISERVELHYTTPSVESLPKWTPTPVNLKDNEEVAELKYVIIDSPEYEYDGTIYNTVATNTTSTEKDGSLYLVTENGDELISSFRFTRKTLDADSEIGNGELIGRYFVGEVNETLYEGNTYKVVWAENTICVKNAFIGKYVYNPEISIILKGAAPVSSDFGLTANVDDRLHSHADVFSFVTDSEVRAGEGAKMVLKDGEENVAEAPVYVSREANGHRVYADFGGQKLEAGKSYDVVLPEGSVYAANGIVNNPEIKSTINAMPEAPAAPEFISIALNIDEYASATYRMVKGEESVIDLKGGNDWKLESLALNGDDVTSEVAENGLYTLPALDEDAKLDAIYGYAHVIDFDFTTGVGQVEECPYGVGKDGSHVVITGLKGGDNIAVYTVGGMKVAELPAVPADMDEASIVLPENQVYVILINATAIKYKH